MTRLLALAASVLLAACAMDGARLKPGISIEADVRRDMGEPAETYPAASGGRLLAYPRGPLGEQTFMVHVTREGVFQRVEQVLDEAHYERIVIGKTTRDELRGLLGPPSQSMSFPRLNQIAWTWRYKDMWGRTADFSAMLDASGIVVKTVAIPLDSAFGMP